MATTKTNNRLTAAHSWKATLPLRRRAAPILGGIVLYDTQISVAINERQGRELRYLIIVVGRIIHFHELGSRTTPNQAFAVRLLTAGAVQVTFTGREGSMRTQIPLRRSRARSAVRRGCREPQGDTSGPGGAPSRLQWK